MKTLIKLGIITLLMFILQTNSSLAQKKKKKKRTSPPSCKQKSGSSSQRWWLTHTEDMFIIHWGPNLAFHRRWVFFPRYNFYWDNRNNYYVYANNGIWMTSPTPPPVVVNINLSDEKNMN